MDESNRDAIHYFNLQGKYIRQIAIIGEGPNNGPSLYDFILEKEGIPILSGKGDHSDITLFTYDNELINKMELDVLSDSFEILENNEKIFITHPTYLIEAINNNIIKERESKEIINNLNANDNPVLLICSIK